jgi:beta-glucosidase
MDGDKLLEDSRRAAGGHRTLRKAVHLEAGKSYPMRMEYAQHQGGSGVELVWAPPADATLAEAVETAKRSDIAIVCIGLNSRLEGEESPIQIPGFEHGDRTNIDLPAPQEKLLNAVLDTGKPVIVVLLNGSALAVTTAQKRAGAILEAWYGGQEGGTAIANTLAGDNNPAGHLPVTFYESTSQLPPFEDYSMKGRTYRFFEGNALYPFGYGLSYSSFKYSKPAVKKPGEVSARVTNTSTVAGDEVAQLYLERPRERPRLRAFRRVHLSAGETRVVNWTVDPAELRDSIVSVGGSQPSHR